MAIFPSNRNYRIGNKEMYFMRANKHLSLFKFLRLGSEQAHASSNLIKRTFFTLFGSLQINPRIRSARIISEILSLRMPENSILLDAGFGHGLGIFALSQYFPNWEIVGYELDSKFFNNAEILINRKNVKNLTIVHKDLEKMDDDNRYDLIYSCDVLEHIHNDVKVLENFKKALKPGGVLLLHLPLRYELCRRIFPSFKNYTTDDHVRDEYVPEEIQQKLEHAGFNVDFIKSGYGLLKGELAFELNNLIRKNKYFLMMSQLLTFPVSIMLGYFDIKFPPTSGNSLIIKASIFGNK
jgi:SAM-dependent methyltransferase